MYESSTTSPLSGGHSFLCITHHYRHRQRHHPPTRLRGVSPLHSIRLNQPASQPACVITAVTGGDCLTGNYIDDSVAQKEVRTLMGVLGRVALAGSYRGMWMRWEEVLWENTV